MGDEMMKQRTEADDGALNATVDHTPAAGGAAAR
jgi:hypothetical protein